MKRISLTPLYETMQWLWQVEADLYQEKPGFDPRPIHVGLVEKVSLGDDKVLSECFSILLAASFQQWSIPIHSAVTGVTRPYRLPETLNNTVQKVKPWPS
jgi:hypothetical protein